MERGCPGCPPRRRPNASECSFRSLPSSEFPHKGLRFNRFPQKPSPLSLSVSLLLLISRQSVPLRHGQAVSRGSRASATTHAVAFEPSQNSLRPDPGELALWRQSRHPDRRRIRERNWVRLTLSLSCLSARPRRSTDPHSPSGLRRATARLLAREGKQIVVPRHDSD